MEKNVRVTFDKNIECDNLGRQVGTSRENF